ncbi:hypothetical protein Taro_004551 [Colocasia esculenta]|uniref:G-patch domain-containing protein n=1 Tax=Colocasia esculenta TaxID=4460 RepID=A0A843TIH3_COLES|nr:hypothetical protein [Colocasia esculenta]
MGEVMGTSSGAIDASNVGFQLLKKCGWKEGTGLGVSEQGRLEPVQTRVKKNKLGLGAEVIKQRKTYVPPDKMKRNKMRGVEESSSVVQNENVSLYIPAMHFSASSYIPYFSECGVEDKPPNDLVPLHAPSPAPSVCEQVIQVLLFSAHTTRSRNILEEKSHLIGKPTMRYPPNQQLHLQWALGSLNLGCPKISTQSKKKTKLASKRLRKMAEEEKRWNEKEFERAFFREFWPDNV